MEKNKEKKGLIPLVIELPKPALQPIMQRIFVKGFAAEDIKTKGGIYIPSIFTKVKGEEMQEWKFERYFVLAVANDVNIKVMEDGKERPLKRGDEVAIFYHEDALKYEPAQVVDFVTNEKYIALHQTEIAGVVSHKKIEDD